MVSTRKSNVVDSPPSSPPSKKLQAELGRLIGGGSGGRAWKNCIGQDNSQASLRSQWDLHKSIENDIKPHCAPAENLHESPCLSCITPPSTNIILPVSDLQHCISTNFICRRCAKASFYLGIEKVLDHLTTELDL